MKNKLAVIFVVTVMFAAVIGCSRINPFAGKSQSNSASNKSLTDQGVDTIVGEEKIGVPECDEVMDMITAEANNPDDNFITKAVKATFFNTIKENIKQAVDENKNKNKNGNADLAKKCREFKQQLVKYKAEQPQKNNNGR